MAFTLQASVGKGSGYGGLWVYGDAEGARIHLNGHIQHLSYDKYNAIIGHFESVSRRADEIFNRQLNELKVKCDLKDKEIITLKASEQECVRLRQQVANQSIQFSQLHTSNSVLSQQNTTKQNEINRLSGLNGGLNESNTTLQREKTALERRVEELTQAVNTRTVELQTANRNHTNTTRDLNARVTVLTEENRQLQTTHAEEIRRLGETHAEEMRSTKFNLKGKIHELKVALDLAQLNGEGGEVNNSNEPSSETNSAVPSEDEADHN